MDLRFTPHDDRPRSTHEPLQSSPTSHPQQHSEITVSVAMVRPGNGMLSDTSRENMADEGGGGGGEANTSNNLANGSVEREENGRPNSAPARTPTSVGPNGMEAMGTASGGTPLRTCPRPRVSRPHLSVPAESILDDTVQSFLLLLVLMWFVVTYDCVYPWASSPVLRRWGHNQLFHSELLIQNIQKGN